MWKLIIIAAIVMNLGEAQRSFYAPKPGSNSRLLPRFRKNDTDTVLGVRENQDDSDSNFSSTLLPEVQGTLEDHRFVHRVSQWPEDRQPFWFKNRYAISSMRDRDIDGGNIQHSNLENEKPRSQFKSPFQRPNRVEGKLDEILDPLHEAARRGNLSFLKECLNQKVSSTGLDSMGNTPLYWASQSGHLDCLLCLLDQPNPPLNVQNHFGDTPLHGASAKGHYSIVETLLKAGGDPRIGNNNGETPEMLAMNLKVKNLLQKHKPSISVPFLAGVGSEDYEDDSD